MVTKPDRKSPPSAPADADYQKHFKIDLPANRAVATALHKSLKKARTREGRDSTRSIVMLSGGLDSVVVLFNVLAETRQRVHAHHIEIDNYEGRARAETLALKKIIAYCRKNIRDFEYTTSRSEFHLGLGGGTDLTLAMFEAARVTKALGGAIDIVYTGHVTSTFWEMSEGAAVFNAAFINRKFKPEWLRPLGRVAGEYRQRKINIYESIPHKLADMTWSCREPVSRGRGFVICGKCRACKTRQKLADDIAGREQVS